MGGTTTAKPAGTHALLFIAALVGVPIAVTIVQVALMMVGFDEDSATGLGQLAAFVGFGWLNTKVGYRWFNVFMMIVPIFGVIYIVKILWRAVSLPHAYWEDDELPTQEVMRLATYMEAIDHGMPSKVAALSCVALIPFDDACPPSPHFEALIRAKMWEFTANTSNDFNEIGTVARAALQVYLALAQEHGEHYYVQRFTEVLEKNQPNRRPRPEAGQRFRAGHGPSEQQNAIEPSRPEKRIDVDERNDCNHDGCTESPRCDCRYRVGGRSG